MRTIFLLAFFIALSARAEGLVYAPLPLENARATVARSHPLVEYLERIGGAHVRIQYHASYSQILRQFAADRVDLAYLGPVPLLALRGMHDGVEVLAVFREADGSSRYTCVLAAPADSAFATGTGTPQAPLRVATTQRLSTCGYVSTMWLLRRAGVAPERIAVDYLGNHEAVATALARGAFPAGGLHAAIAARFERLGVVKLAETPPLPGFVLVANRRTMSAPQIEALRRGLLEAGPDELAALDLGRRGFSAPEGDSFAGLEAMLKEIGVSPLELVERAP